VIRWLPLLLLAGPASAAPKVDALAVLPLIVAGPHGAASISSVYADVAAAARTRLGLRLLSAEEIFVSSSDVAGRVSDCGSDIDCIANKLRAFDARYGMVVVANFALEPPLISVQLLDTDARTMMANSIGELAAGGAVSAAVRQHALTVLDGAGFVVAGRLVVDVTPAGATVLVPGATPDVGAPNRFTLAPGGYEIRADAAGYHPNAATAQVVAGESTKIELTLVEETSVAEQWWFWGLIGVAVAGGVTAAVVGTATTETCLCATLDGAGCGCD